MSLVREFRQRFGMAPSTPPLRPDPDDVRYQARLIREEFNEVMVELATLANTTDPHTIVAIYRRLLKELADLRYVTEGCAVALGLPIEEAFAAVHASNMTKTHALDGTGRVIKGEHYQEPDMAMLVRSIVTIPEGGIT